VYGDMGESEHPAAKAPGWGHLLATEACYRMHATAEGSHAGGHLSALTMLVWCRCRARMHMHLQKRCSLLGMLGVWEGFLIRRCMHAGRATRQRACGTRSWGALRTWCCMWATLRTRMETLPSGTRSWTRWSRTRRRCPT
jgi:hypothetical protein